MKSHAKRVHKLKFLIAGMVVLFGLISYYVWYGANHFNIGRFVSPQIAQALSKQKTVYNYDDPITRDLSAAVLYYDVPNAVLDQIANTGPEKIWKSCQLFTDNHTCETDWLHPSWIVTSHPNVDTETDKTVLGFELHPATQCSQVANYYVDKAKNLKRVSMDGSGVVYLCFNKPLHLVQVHAWTT